MKIAFYRNIGIPIDSIDYIKGTGGLEMQAIGLGRELARRGHEVIFYVNCLNPGIYDGVVYKKVADYQGKPSESDVLIGIDITPPESKAKRVGWMLTPTMGWPLDLDLVVCDGYWTLKHYQNNRPTDNAVMIPCGFDYKLYAEPQLPKKRNSIMFAGHPMKGMGRLPDIFKKVKSRIPSATCNVYGGSMLWKDGNPIYQEVYSRLIEAGINYHGLVSKETLLEAFKTSEVYFLPRSGYIETFGLSVVEAMASGCVPVCSKRGNLVNLITEDSGVLLEYNEDIDEAQTLIDLLTNEEKLERLRKGAIESVKKYDWSNVINLWEKGLL